MTAATWDVTAAVLRVLVSLVFIGMGVNHFVPGAARTMAAMVPPALRAGGILRPINLIYVTGVCEIAGGIGLLVPSTRLAAGVALVVFLAAVFPANAYAAAHRDRFGALAIPFWPRLFAQIALAAMIVWVSLPR